MLELPIASWSGVVVILVLLFLAALLGPASRSADSGSQTSPQVDLSLWIAGRGPPYRGSPLPRYGRTSFPQGPWSGYYDQQFAGALRRVRH
jgi:hypothetical protein